ncbi:hypothetical protein LRS74_17780 [Streptomyces sp. LX-29]|uniref:metallophosphoesterase family protein n=1 Tax=Streptomyces sp. LX-29 TaxID=2900152 RepID=UPI00240D68C0|nr:metallophosphoesterase [Streptomyces sp. LX-29]WFB11698.1 hypothetical protein LRS74_17780 [Streptomyces sp. LX-29]
MVLIAVTVLGSWLGLLAVGGVHASVGPMETRMALRPSLTGGTSIDVSPLGSLEFRSHRAPLRLDVDVDRLDPVRSEALVEHPERLSGLQEEVADDVVHGTRELAIRSCAAVAFGATALGLAVFRRPRRALAAGGLALALLASSGVAAYATWNPKSVLEPRYSGLLSSAPAVVGSARTIADDFDVYQGELARLVANVTKVYEATSTLPAYQPDPTTMRVLHVSDIRLNPLSWHVVRSLVQRYEIDVIVDTGDTTGRGTTAENGFLAPVSDLGAPYVWVRGDRDSRDTQAYLSGRRGVTVLDDGRAVTVAGLRIAGVGAPRSAADRSATAADDDKSTERRAGRRLAAGLRAQRAAGTPVDIALAHHPAAAREADGAVPLVLAGHARHRESELLPGGTRLMIGGSTGGTGFGAFGGTEPDEVRASVLYLDRDTHRLQVWDEIELDGLGLTKAEVSRHLPEES